MSNYIQRAISLSVTEWGYGSFFGCIPVCGAASAGVTAVISRLEAAPEVPVMVISTLMTAPRRLATAPGLLAMVIRIVAAMSGCRVEPMEPGLADVKTAVKTV